jgi:hypothetical protein
VKSPSTATTSAPSGNEAATTPAKADTWLPTLTSCTAAPTRRANAARAAATSGS